MAGTTAATTQLRRLWLLAVALFAVGVVVPGGGGALAAPGAVVLAVAAGVTAARGRASGPLVLLAWAVPVVPSVAFVSLTAWLLVDRSDPLAVYLFVSLVGAVVLGTWAVFLVALVAEVVRGRRRRFGAAGPAWKNDPTPPSYS